MPKKLSILELFDSLGYLWGSYDEETDRIKFSFRTLFKSYAILFFMIFFPFKMLYCLKMIGAEDKELRVIAGDIFHYFQPDTKAFITLSGWLVLIECFNSKFQYFGFKLILLLVPKV